MAITASYDTLLEQASDAAGAFFRSAVRTIDQRFEEGYAQEHPELVAAFMQVAGNDFRFSTLVVAIQEAASEIAGAMQRE